jgi:hypothetical protein
MIKKLAGTFLCESGLSDTISFGATFLFRYTRRRIGLAMGAANSQSTFDPPLRLLYGYPVERRD